MSLLVLSFWLCLTVHLAFYALALWWNGQVLIVGEYRAWVSLAVTFISWPGAIVFFLALMLCPTFLHGLNAKFSEFVADQRFKYEFLLQEIANYFRGNTFVFANVASDYSSVL
jgi:hypothetical protein